MMDVAAGRQTARNITLVMQFHWFQRALVGVANLGYKLWSVMKINIHLVTMTIMSIGKWV